MTNYFFLTSVLPELEIDKPIEMHFSELMKLFKQNMHPKDFAKTRTLRLLIDLANVKEALREGSFDPRGNLNRKELDDALLNQKNLPEYLFDYLEEFETQEEQLTHFSKVYTRYFSEELPKATGVMKEYLTFERDIRLLVSAYRARKLGRDIAQECKYEDPTDPLVSYLIANKGAPELGMPFEYTDLKEVLIKCEGSPSDQFTGLSSYRIKKVKEMVTNRLFTTDFLLVYMIVLYFLENWFGLDEERGGHILNIILKETA